MALKIGQIRNTNSVSNYMTDITSTTAVGTAQSLNPFGGKTAFDDFSINVNLTEGIVYYLTLKIEKKEEGAYKYNDTDYSNLKLSLRLQQENVYETTKNPPPQNLNVLYYTIGKKDGQNSDYFYLDIVFVPLQNTYNRIVLQIERNIYDAIYQNTSGPRKLKRNNNDVLEYKLYTLNNIKPNNNSWIKMGIQTRPGSLIVVNKEPIRIGRSGIYELNNGTKITEVMLASSDENINPFLLDYIQET